MSRRETLDYLVSAGFTQRQAQAWPDAIERIRRHGCEAKEDPASHGWVLDWWDETRPGRGRYLSAIYWDGETIAQIAMDVYGYPIVSVSRCELIHSDADEECPCDDCEAVERVVRGEASI